MADFSFKQGESKKILLPIVKNGSNVVISGVTKIMAKILVDSVAVKNYSLTPEGDYGTLAIDGTNDYQVNLFVERGDSKTFPVGVITIAVVLDFTDNSFASGFRSEEYQFRVGRVLEGQGIDLNL